MGATALLASRCNSSNSIASTVNRISVLHGVGSPWWRVSTGDRNKVGIQRGSSLEQLAQYGWCAWWGGYISRLTPDTSAAVLQILACQL